MAVKKVDTNRFPKLLLQLDGDDGTPAADTVAVYAAADGTIHTVQDDGTDAEIGGGAVADILDLPTAETDDALVLAPDGAGGVEWRAEAGAGASLTLPEGSAPSSPASGYAVIYAKSDGRIYSKDDAGTEYGPFDVAGGGGGPLLAIDDVALDANGTDFASMSGWTAIGTASASAGTPNDYDADVQDIAMPAQGDGYYRAYPGDGVTCYLTVHGTVQPGGMMCLAFLDGSNNGSGVGPYNDGNVYTWNIAAGAFTGNDGVLSNCPWGAATSNGTSYILRLSRSGSTVTTGISWDGGKTWFTDTKTDSTAFTRVAIIRAYTTGGTANVLTVGRYNEV